MNIPDLAQPAPFLPSLRYWLVVPGEDIEHTPFQGFGLDIIDPAYSNLVGLLSVLPASIPEIFAEPEALADLRRPLPTKRAAIVGLPTFLALLARPLREDEIDVALGLPAQIEAMLAAAGGSRPIFASLFPTAGAVALADFQGHPAQLLDTSIRDALVSRAPVGIREKVAGIPLRSPFAQGTEPSRISGVTIPNEALSASLGHAYSGTDPILSGETDTYVDAILHSVQRARTLIGEESTDVLLYAPAIVRSLYAFGSTFWNNTFRRIRSPSTREILKDGVFRNPGYSGFSIALDDPENVPNPYDDPVAGPLLTVRQTELRLTAAGVGALASSNMQPAIRLPNAVNFHNANLRDIEQHSDRNTPRARRLLQQSYRKLADGLYGQIHPEIIDGLRLRTEAITLVADAPIEWLRIDGMPLMIRHEVSRIGMTPGNLMLAQCIQAGTLTLPPSAFDDVLVVRSFQHNDPIREVLERAIQHFGLQRVRVRFVDVATRDELVTCLNEFKGVLAVFDCHGGHSGDDGHGWLRIGREKIDVWQLANVARIPPIVVLSACSTFALAGSHASVANGLMRSGALTVIGTFLPVDAVRSAAFVARLLYRIDKFLPALKALDRNFVTWRTLVSTFLRMSYATDLLHFFIEEKQWLDQTMFNRIGVQANHDINQLRNDWYQRLIRRIGGAARRSVAEVQSVIETESPLVETMYYCQTGRPEAIGIYLGDEPMGSDTYAAPLPAVSPP
ncbi:hypothetical protein [Thermomonas fusca]|uniref:hypothetical protein n=1 Tax=Thermomonas fusca TaxID=215690 RepID=UPI0003FA1D81|nr:hypothetical protein [Thermomonas fusca]